jgi:hypothetical protein
VSKLLLIFESTNQIERKSIMKRIILILLSCTSLGFAQTGANVGLSYLKIGVDARASAMGEAYSAVANDASASFWNPAGLASSGKNSIVLMHNAWLQDINHEFAAIQFVNGQHNLAVSLNLISVEGIELRDETASEKPIGETHALNTYVGLSYATHILGNWQIGAQVKYLYEKYYYFTADGFALDVGLKKENLISDLSWGLVVQNLGKMSALKTESTTLPLILRTGFSYILPFPVLENSPILATDIAYVADDITTLNLGTEVPLGDIVDVRLGYVIGRESQGITAGFGLRYGIFNIAYAFVPYSFDLGNSHRFSLVVDI